MEDKNCVKNALTQAELSDPVDNMIELTDLLFNTIDGFNTQLTVFDLQQVIGKLKKYHEFNKLMLKYQQRKTQ